MSKVFLITGSARGLGRDLTDAPGALAAVAQALATFGRLDVVVNNAGYANVASVGGRVTSPGLSAHQAAKWAVGGFSGVLAVSPAYEPTVGFSVSRLEQWMEKAAGDPAKVAQVVLQIAELDEPPVRLLLGVTPCSMPEWSRRLSRSPTRAGTT